MTFVARDPVPRALTLAARLLPHDAREEVVGELLARHRDVRGRARRARHCGATSGRTAGLVVRRVLSLTAAGVVIGIGLALASQQVLSSFVADVRVAIR